MKTKLIAALFGIMILSCLSASVYADQINTQNLDQAIASIASQTADINVEQVGTQWVPPPPLPPPHRPWGPRPPIPPVPPVPPPPPFFW